jgi:hypothetical protein
VRSAIGKSRRTPTRSNSWPPTSIRTRAGPTRSVGPDYVLRVASPVPTVDPKSDEELVRPARDGTRRVIKAARDAEVKRVVMTSSISAIIYGRGVREKPSTEEDWTDETNRDDSSPYDRSKTIAERAAWAWLAAEGGRLELVAVNPAWFSDARWDLLRPQSVSVAPGAPWVETTLELSPWYRNCTSCSTTMTRACARRPLWRWRTSSADRAGYRLRNDR